MQKKYLRPRIFAAVLIIATLCIGFGAYKVWRSFTEFNEATLNEKDSQFYNLLGSDDINIENTVDAFVREADTLFSRDGVSYAREIWIDSIEYGEEDYSELSRIFSGTTLGENPVYSDIFVVRDGKTVFSASGNGAYTFNTEPDEKNLRVCTAPDGSFCMAYEYKADDGVSYEAVIDLDKLYRSSIGDKSDVDEMIMLDSSGTLVIYETSGGLKIEAASAEQDADTEACLEYIAECVKKKSNGGSSIDLRGQDGNAYTARVVVLTVNNSKNGEFTFGVTANYEEVLKTSRTAATRILLYGIIAITGVALLLLMLILLRKIDSDNLAELEMLKKRNDTMEELNQRMQELSHHQRLETIGTMTASIAHDFNNLLTPIMGYSLMTMEMLPPEETDLQENLLEIYNASIKAKDIVSRLAELTKKGKIESFREINPDELIRNAIKVTLPAKPKNINVKGKFKAGDAKIKGDSTQLAQLVMNIVLNAFDAMREKGGTLLVSTETEDDMVMLRFRDNGPGMDAETQSRIFDPFYTTKESGKGTGLGLAIVAQIVTTHNGKIYVNSEPGEGTEFRVLFPKC